MDPAMPLSQISQGIPRVPSSSDLEDDLFQTFFDWKAYSLATQPYPHPHPHDKSSHRVHPQDLDKLITDIPPLLDALESHKFFKMGTSFGSDDGVVTSSDYSGHPSPPELILGEGSTSPSDHSGPVMPDRIEDPVHHPGRTLTDVRAHDDKWTYPQSELSKGAPRVYPPSLHVAAPHGPTKPADQVAASAGTKRRRAENVPEKRPRQLADREQTADVRKSGACLPCRVSKTRCHDNGVCPACRKAFPEHSHIVCTRMSLAEAWPVMSRAQDAWSKDPRKEEQFRLSPTLFTGKPREITIFFSRDVNTTPLSAFVQAYRWNDERDDSKVEKAAFVRDLIPSHQKLIQWVEGQIRLEKGRDFRSAVQRFLMAYSHDGVGLPRHSLVTRVHRMACFFRIWSTAAFSCRDPSGKIVGLPMSVQAELRSIALRGLSLLEGDIFKELDDCVTPSGMPKPDDKLAIWACMWQLMFMYRDLMSASRARDERGQASNENEQRTKWHPENFFPVIAIFYHYHFRNKKSIEVSMDWLKSPYPSQAYRSKDLQQAGKDMLDGRKPFLQKMQTSTNDMDQLLCVFVVNHEVKKLNARRRTPKSGKTKGSGADDDCDDDVE